MEWNHRVLVRTNHVETWCQLPGKTKIGQVFATIDALAFSGPCCPVWMGPADQLLVMCVQWELQQMNGGREEGALGTCVLLAVCSHSGLSCQATFSVSISILKVLEEPLPLAPSTGICVTLKNLLSVVSLHHVPCMWSS